MKEIHLINDDEEGNEREHTTRDCWCSPIITDLKPNSWLRATERVVFHREVGSSK